MFLDLAFEGARSNNRTMQFRGRKQSERPTRVNGLTSLGPQGRPLTGAGMTGPRESRLGDEKHTQPDRNTSHKPSRILANLHLIGGRRRFGSK